MNYDKAKQYVEELLQGLDASLIYHNAWHTLADVIPATERLAEINGIQGDELVLLKTAALFHDVGYLKCYENNEPIAAAMAEEILPEFGFNSEQIDVIKSLILTTKMPQQPKTLLQEIICDADLDSLGRDDFFELSLNLLTELNAQGRNIDTEEWKDAQCSFLENHVYFTDAARDTRNSVKLTNSKALKRSND